PRAASGARRGGGEGARATLRAAGLAAWAAFVRRGTGAPRRLDRGAPASVPGLAFLVGVGEDFQGRVGERLPAHDRDDGGLALLLRAPDDRVHHAQQRVAALVLGPALLGALRDAGRLALDRGAAPRDDVDREDVALRRAELLHAFLHGGQDRLPAVE